VGILLTPTWEFDLVLAVKEKKMISRDQFMKMYDEYGELMTKLKRVQKENEKLRESYEILKREADYWEREAKKMNEKNHKLRAQLKLWMGTGK
jgi:septal ring factor EnvC (AmiA/AmiB activator)|tara:strand:- start:1063 stop:1341 length:279 start_codon:yes stop_codon:yes gene_type:complete